MEATNPTMPIETLWNDLHGELLAFASHRVRTASEAEDIVQTAFLRAHRQLESGTTPTNPRGWLYQIVRNLAIDSYRRNQRREANDRRTDLDFETVEDRSEPEVDDDGVHAAVAKVLPIFIDRLSDSYRDALRWTEIEGLTQAEAAERAGISLSGMKSRVQRARKRLLATLQECCEFGLDARNRVIECTRRAPDIEAWCDPEPGDQDCAPP